MAVFEEFELYGHMITSNRYKQGIDIEYDDRRYDKKTHGIYILRCFSASLGAGETNIVMYMYINSLTHLK